VLIVCFGLSFLRRPSLFLFYCAATAALVLIFVGFYPGWLRHHGLIVIVLVAALWVEPAFAEVRLGPWLRRASDTACRVRAVVFPVLLTAQCLGAAIAVYMDAKFPFSPAKATAQLIRDRGLEAAPIVGDAAFVVQSVLGYLPGARDAYYPASGRSESFPRWNRSKAQSKAQTPTWSRLIEAARTQSADRVVIVLGYRNAQHRPKAAHITHLGYFPKSMAMGEEYDVYLWQRHPRGVRDTDE
jgi:hypothetical protein